MNTSGKSKGCMPDWEAIVATEGPAIWRTIWRFVRNRADADECFQETFLSALKLSQASSNPVTHWRALLTRIATARAVDRLRQRTRHSVHEETSEIEVIDHDAPQPLDNARGAELSDRLRHALAKLPAKQAEVFSLACIDQWSYEQVAEHLEISVDSVGVLVHRARARLRELLASMNEVSR
jgi:RNA polymerase sigma-70 factor, ECF subfamily